MKSSARFAFWIGVIFSGSCVDAQVLSFSKAYELALERANHIRSATYNAQAQKERVNQERAALYPQINFSSFYKKSELEQNPTGNTIEQGLINYSFSARQSIYDAEIYSRIDMQKSRSELSEAQAELKKRELAQELFGSYLNLLKSKNRIDLLEAYLSYSQARLQELFTRYEMNLSNKMDFMEMQVEHDTSKIELQKEKRLYEINHLKFKNFIGDEEFELPELRSRSEVYATVQKMKGSVVRKEELEKSLYLRVAQANIDVSASELENAKDGHLPKLSFDASYSVFDTDTPTIDAPFSSVQYMMLSLNIPIYSGGHTESKIDSSRLMRQAAIEDMYSTQKEIRVMFEEYQTRFEASLESVYMYNTAYDSAELFVDAIEQGYENGLKSVTDLNEAKNKFYEIKFKYIDNIYELVDSYIGVSIVTDDFEGLSLLDELIEEK